MHKKIITFASILAITSIGYAKAPDLGNNYKLTTSDHIDANFTVSDLTGAPVIDKYGERIATIQDLEVNPSTGEIMTAYLEVGGVMGIGSKYAALPYSELTYDKSKAHFSVKTTHSEVKAYISNQERSMDKHAHDHAGDAHSDHKHNYDKHDDDNRITNMWQKVKTSLGVEDEELAEVEAEVRGNKLYLEGEVRDRELKQKIGDAFKSSSELQVINKIKVVK